MNHTPSWQTFLDEKKQTFPFFAAALAHQEALLQPLGCNSDALAAALQDHKHGLQGTWEQALADFFQAFEDKENVLRKIANAVILRPEITKESLAGEKLAQLLQVLRPWRKGPFDFFGVFVDSEWRSDYKWQRLQSCADWRGQSVLDVGCGNGYFLWQLQQAGAQKILGIDPSLHYFYQFLISYLPLPSTNVGFLPLALEALPPKAAFDSPALNRSAFDSVLSMGVLYHRRCPLEHLALLAKFLKPEGLLFIETLIVEHQAALFPADTYAGMPNVWCIPSLETLGIWMKRLGFFDFTVHDVSVTTSNEQRQTAWLDSFSLAHFLHPNDPTKTIEGHPAPLRALVSVRRKKA